MYTAIAAGMALPAIMPVPNTAATIARLPTKLPARRGRADGKR